MPRFAAAQEAHQAEARVGAPIAEAAGDALRIKHDRDVLIYAPGEQLSFELRCGLADVAPGTALDIQTTLSPARRGEALWSEQQRLAVPVEGQARGVFQVPLPQTDGVYTVRVTAARPAGFRERFFPAIGRQGDQLAQRSFDVVVLAARPGATPAEAGRLETVLEIDPTAARWWDRLPSWTQVRRIPGLNRGPLGSLRAGSVELASGRYVELPPTPGGAEPHWQAYSLPLEAVGAAHLLEIDYPADQEQHLSISIVEPNAAGVVEGIGRDWGVYVEGFGRREAPPRQTHRIVFWPRTQAPLLLVTNAHPTAAAHFGGIRVRKRSGGRLWPAAGTAATSERLVAAYLARPFAAETFGASHAPGGPTAQDWQTHYETATRLADYLHYAGYNSAVVNVPTSTSSRPDDLELLLRVFDREGLALVPAIRFAGPIPELEALRRGSDAHTSGLEWIGADGRTWSASQAAQGEPPILYNLLEPRVQQAMLRVAEELLERFGEHPSLAGLAVQLGANSYGQLLPLEWGLDDATVARFERDTGIKLEAAGPNRFAARHALLTGTHEAAWRTWRAGQMTAFYGQLAALVRKRNGERRLLITTEDALASAPLAARVRPTLLTGSRVKSTLLDVGVDRASLEEVPGIVLCPSRFVGPGVPLRDRALDLEFNQAAAAWHRRTSSSVPAILLYHRAQRRRLGSFATKSPFPMAGEPELVCYPLAHGAEVRKPYVYTLLDNDPAVVLDGGVCLPLGQEDALRGVRMILRQLPTRAEVSETASQPVFVRTYAEADGVTLLVMNASPWQADAELTLDVAQAVSVVPLAGADSASAERWRSGMLTAGTPTISLRLEPYGVEAVRIASPGVRVAEVRAAVGDGAKAELAERIGELTSRDLTAPHEYQAPRNRGFEPIGGAGPLPGWRLIAAPGTATAELDATAPQEGRTSLFFHSEGQFAAVESEPFPTPATGQLWMTVFARGQQLSPNTELLMAFEAAQGPATYRRAFVVGGARAGAQPLAGQWQSYAIWVNDLPLETGSEMRVRFELTGPGEVWLDNLVLYDLLFPLPWYQKETQAGKAEIERLVILIHAAQSAFEKGAVADCVRWLESYWPRFLLAYTPRVEPSIARDAAPAESPPPAEQGQEPAPGIGERFKSKLPFWR